MIPEYQYRIQDDSLITPYIKSWMVAPLLRFVPWWLPANIITIFSNLFLYIALFMALSSYPGRSFRFVFISALMIFYLIGDHLDGMQARRTGTSSPLGEFCDHFLDVFNTGIVLYIVCLSFEINNSVLVAFFIIAGYLTHVGIFYEQFSTKCLYFGKIGAAESVFILSGCILIAAIEPLYCFVLSSPFGGLTIVEILFILSSSGAFVTFAQIVIRSRIKDFGFWFFCFFLIFVGFATAIFLSPTEVCFVLSAYSVVYIGNLQRGHLADGKKRFPDYAVPLFMLIALAFEPLRTPIFLWGIYTYIICRIFGVAYNAFFRLREFWLWKNPKNINN